MTADIKAMVAELIRVRQEIRGEPIEQAKSGFYTVLLHQIAPHVIVELQRLWEIEEAARRYREVQDAYNERLRDWVIDATLAEKINAARDVFFSSLPPRKEKQ